IKPATTNRLFSLVLIAMSLVFICCYNLPSAALLILVGLLTHFMGLLIFNSTDAKQKKLLLIIALVILVGLLFAFKYTAFVVDSVLAIAGGASLTLSIFLPVGISFYTFTSIGYLVDVFNGKYEASQNLAHTMLFTCFFPKLVSGPIVRGNDFFPQLKNFQGITASNLSWGMQVFVFGLFKKVVLANRLNIFVNNVFFSPSIFTRGTVILGIISYSLQIYFDFSGYSDMAIGVSRMFGIDLKPNFNLPYMAKNPSDFWNRWHISLSGWLRDYVYIPLGGNRKGTLRTYVNLLLVMLISGIWHGAGYTYIVWGLGHGLISCFSRLLNSNQKIKAFLQQPVMNFLRILGTFCCVSILWVFFRASNLTNALTVLKGAVVTNGQVSQPFVWSFVAIICLSIGILAALIKSKKEATSLDGFYPVMNLRTVPGLVFFFTFTGLTLILGYFANSVFIYGNY
ncbi:MAG: MBOAT family protein, partial [Pseudobutyrivibrio sp.]|nr:MBOAT family protein [Pseudobutyrivibrio sp.]MCF0186103.1 MBOAT family protein [Bacteroidaceae bacterium]